MEARLLILMAAVGLLAICCLRRSYRGGLAVAVALMVTMPGSLRLELPGGLPEFTVQRLVLLILIAWAVFGLTRKVVRRPVPIIRLFILLLIAQFISLCLSIDGKASFKSFLAFSLEVVVFYVLLSRSVADRAQIQRMMYVLMSALALVAATAWIERRWDFNISRYLITGDGNSPLDVTATFPHRIIFGYAMAMAVPMLLALIQREHLRQRRRRLWIMVLLVSSACYFSNSRGPWIGLAAGGSVMMLFGTPGIRRKFILLCLAATLVVIARPGVRDTLVSAFQSTFYAESLKGRSYEYRWRLWYVAFSEIRKSPSRMLFGYGGLSTEKMDLSSYFERESGGTTNALGYTSWDNQLACNLIEFGIVGFSIEVVLLIAIMRTLISGLRTARGPDRTMMLAFTSAGVIYLFALTNVYIFSPQLKFLFWTLMVCGLRWMKEVARERREAARDDVARDTPAPVGGPMMGWNN